MGFEIYYNFFHNYKQIKKHIGIIEKARDALSNKQKTCYRVRLIIYDCNENLVTSQSFNFIPKEIVYFKDNNTLRSNILKRLIFYTQLYSKLEAKNKKLIHFLKLSRCICPLNVDINFELENELMGLSFHFIKSTDFSTLLTMSNDDFFSAKKKYYDDCKLVINGRIVGTGFPCYCPIE